MPATTGTPSQKDAGENDEADEAAAAGAIATDAFAGGDGDSKEATSASNGLATTPLKSNRANNCNGTRARDETTKRRRQARGDGNTSNTDNGNNKHKARKSKRRHRQAKRGSSAASSSRAVPRHRSGRTIRCASIHPDATHQDEEVDATITMSQQHYHDQPRPTPPIHLPHNQYEVIIRRRAIVREEDLQKRSEELAQQAQQERQKERDVEDGKRRTVVGTAEQHQHHYYGWPRGGHPKSTGDQDQQPVRSAKKPTVAVVSEDEEVDSDVDDAVEKGASSTVADIDTVVDAANDKQTNNEPVEEEHDDDLAGDTSLGLKLTILGGHVIVQGLNSLADGRASPAQLTGLVRRGDVLVAIDGRSLVHLPLDRLADALKPLSEPEAESFVPPVGSDESGADASFAGIPPGVPCYRRTLRLRFSMGEGLPFLNRPRGRRRLPPPATRPADPDADATSATDQRSGEKQQQAAAFAAEDIAADVLGLTQFLMVDQLSGLPMFGDDYHKQAATATETPVEGKGGGSGESISSDTIASAVDVAGTTAPSSSSDDSAAVALQSSAMAVKMLGLSTTSAARLSKQIAYEIAQERKGERTRSISLFFELNKKGSVLLRGSDAFDVATRSSDDGLSLLTYGEMMDLGRMAVLGADSLVNKAMEADLAAGVQKQRKLDSIDKERSNDDSSMEAGDGDDINSSSDMLGSTGAKGDVDVDSDVRGHGSQSLVRLAARDEMWRNQLMSKLLDAAAAEESGDDPKTTNIDNNHSQPDNQGGIESQLQNLFWGDKVTTLMKKIRQRPLALPPKDIASTLFDLTSGIAMLSDDISRRIATSGRLVQDQQVATQFVLTEALPALLKTFRPLPWQQRRMLWPLISSTGSDVDSRLTDGDMTLSVASTSTGWGTPGQRKNLEEQIEDLELDVEIRAETCYLVTFYFIRQLLALPCITSTDEGGKSCIDSWTQSPTTSSTANTSTATPEEERVIDFIKKYGSYLKLHTCIVRASDVGSGPILRTLLDMARFDLRHRDCLKRLSNKQTTFFLYESVMLSAILVRLRQISTSSGESANEELLQIIPLLVSAHPDLEPKVVRTAFLSTAPPRDTDRHRHQRRTAYYRYLSLLLDVDEGIDSARSDRCLMEEWCNLSVELYQESLDSNAPSAVESESFLCNFRAVALQHSREEGGFDSFRDVPMLMDLSMQVKDYKLATQLAGEIISTKTYSRDSNVIPKVVAHIREMFASELVTLNPSERYSNGNLVQALIQLLNSMSTSPSPDWQNAISVPDEFVKMLGLCSIGPDAPTSEKEKLLLSILVEMAIPSDVLAAVLRWNKCEKVSSAVIPAIRSSLSSASLQEKERIQLLRIRREQKGKGWDQSDRPQASDGTIWERALKGEVAIDK